MTPVIRNAEALRRLAGPQRTSGVGWGALGHMTRQLPEGSTAQRRKCPGRFRIFAEPTGAAALAQLLLSSITHSQDRG